MQLSEDKRSFRGILLNHAARYPAWQVVDVYKLIHQAAMGSEHAVTDPLRAALWLEEELKMLTPGQVEPLIDPISENAEVVRVHLRPFRLAGLEPVLLLDAFLATASGFLGSSEQLEFYWQQAIDLAVSGQVRLDPRALERMIMEMRAAGYPAAHHSPQYRRRYNPAYRVVARKYLPPEWMNLL